jgi:hypothetical protein
MARLTGPYVGFVGDSTRRTTTQEMPLGTRAYGPSGEEFVYIKAGASIAQYDACKFNGSAAGYDDVRPTSATQQYIVGVADAAFDANAYGFIQSKGVCTCKVNTSDAAGSLLVTKATAGTLTLAAATSLPSTPAVALVTGVAAGSAIVLR